MCLSWCGFRTDSFSQWCKIYSCPSRVGKAENVGLFQAEALSMALFLCSGLQVTILSRKENEQILEYSQWDLKLPMKEYSSVF